MASVTEPTAPPSDTSRAGGELAAAVRAVLRPLASLQLTVVLFALSLGLVFFGTLAQMNNGIWTVVDKYFWSEIVWVDVQLLVQFGQIFFGLDKSMTVGGAFPFVGGRLLGAAMLLNLLAAHALRFRFGWKQVGIWMIHGGLILLFVGEFITREFQVEQRMTIREGETVNYTENSRSCELAFTKAEADGDAVTVVPATLLRTAAKTGERITHPDLPVDVRVERYMVNSKLADPASVKDNPATAGVGRTEAASELPEVSGTDPNQTIDVPSAYMTLFKKGTDEKLGTYLVSLWFTTGFNPEAMPKQSVTADGQSYDLALRFTRLYKPYSLHLVNFRFDRYVGTEKAKNYSSQVILTDPERDHRREVTISMNDPLRYRGETFYQSGFDNATEKATILQVVRNPGWILPYASCALVTVGMVVHFGMYLGLFLGRLRVRAGAPTAATAKTPVARPTALERWLPWAALGIAALYLLSQAVPRPTGGPLDLRMAARIPVVEGGRVKPLDTVARVDLRLISSREEFVDEDGTKRPAIRWLLGSMSAPPTARSAVLKYKIFRIENDKLLDTLGLKRREGLRYSLDEIQPKAREFERAVEEARKVPAKQRDVYEAKVLELAEHLRTQIDLLNRTSPLMLPPAEGKEWRAVGEYDRLASRQAPLLALQRMGLTREDFPKLTREQMDRFEAEYDKARVDLLGQLVADDPQAMKLIAVFAAYRSGEADRFEKAVAEYREAVEASLSPGDRFRIKLEAFLNESALYYHCTGLYVFAFLLSAGGWVAAVVRPGLGESFRRAALWVLLVTFAAHTITLLGRMYLMDRPLVFVTNLYSSAVFIGWAAVAICLVVERIFPVGLGNVVASALGFATTVIAHNLAASGDTLEMMQAVLDTNFWLATHVTTVTLGYSATYIAGVVGLVYVLLGIFTPVLNRPTAIGTGANARPLDLGRVIGMVLYGIIALATLFSFVGTVLGGIWADQSWGRFWGWDPKENGAVLIVIWNALILHARWCGLVKDRGMAILALIGNMITTWSWFGTNQLGVGLHAYGFDNRLAFGCMVTWVAHALLVAVAIALPKTVWVSFAPAGRK